jgi:hypothetical protein
MATTKRIQTCAQAINSPDQDYKVELIEEVQYWKNRWSEHPLNRSSSNWNIEGYAMKDWDLKFDHKRFVLLQDAVWKYAQKGKMVYATKPKKLQTMYVGKNNIEVVKPYQTMFCGASECHEPEDLMSESLNFFKYDERTHFKFTYGNFEAALKITKHIWYPRLKYRKAKQNWQYIIWPMCYEFLMELQKELNGYNEEFMHNFNKNVDDELVVDLENLNVEALEEKAVESDVDEVLHVTATTTKVTVLTSEQVLLNEEVENSEDELLYDNEFSAVPREYRPAESIFPFRWYPKIVVPLRKVNKIKAAPYSVFPKYEAERCFFDELSRVYLKIGRPDLAIKIKYPIRLTWLREKAIRHEYNEYLFGKLDNLTLIDEQFEDMQAQGGESTSELRGIRCVDPNVYRSRALRFLSQSMNLMQRHLDKMLVLSHRGKFSYLTRWDLNLFNRQKRVIRTLDKELIDAYIKIYSVASHDIVVSVPSTYVEEAKYVVDACELAYTIKDDHNIYVALQSLCILIERWYNAEFNERKTICWQAQSDEVSFDPKPQRQNFVGSSNSSPQSAGPVKEEVLDEPIKEGDKQVTITMVDQREEQQTGSDDIKSDVATLGTTPELAYSLQDMVKRPMFIDRINWSTSDEGSKILKSYMLPDVYFSGQKSKSNKVVCQNLNASYVLSMFGSCKFDMKVKVQINSVKFQQGMLIVFFKPFYDANRAGDIFENVVQYPHLKIDSSVSNPVQMTIPWTHFRDAFPLYNDPHAEYNYFGSFHVAVWNKLQTGATGSTDASISIWMWLENLKTYQLCNPKDPGQVSFADKIIGQKEGEVETLNIGRNTVSSVKVWEPQALEGVLSAGTGLVEQYGANLVEGLLNRVARGSNSKPTGIFPPAQQTIQVMSNASPGEGIDTSNRLSLSPLSASSKTHDVSGLDSMNALLRKWSRIRVAEWRVDDAENTSIIRLPVTPMINSAKTSEKFPVDVYSRYYYNNTTTTCDWTDLTNQVCFYKRYCSMLDYISRMFMFWRGSLRWRFEIVCTSMHSGRLLIRYEPYGSSVSAVEECQKMATPGVVWDVQEKHELEMDTPYMSVQPWLTTQYVSDGNITDTNVSQSSNGILEISIINRLKVTTGIANNVQINIYLAAGNDFRLSVIAPKEGTVAIRDPNYFTKSKVDISDTVQERLWALLDRYCMAPVTLGWISVKSEVMNNYNWKYADQVGPFATRAKLDTHYLVFCQNVNECLKVVNDDVAKEHLPVLEMNSVDAAFQYLMGFARYWPERILEASSVAPQLNLLSPINYQKLMFAYACALIHYRSYELKHIPEHNKYLFSIITKLPKTKWVPQSNEDVKGKAINPFNKFLPPTPSDNQLMGESFMDMYKVCKRWNMWMEHTTPPDLGPDPVSQDMTDSNWKTFSQHIMALSPWERDQFMIEFRIPVTPMTPYHTVGGFDHTFVSGYNKGSQKPFGCYINEQLGGISAGSKASITSTRYFGELFTFWRGSLRYRFTFPYNYNGNSNWWCYIMYNPRQFTDWRHGMTSCNFVSQERVRQYSKLGTVLYTGNVMSAIDIEVPYYSKYNKLYCSENISTDIASSGTIFVYIPLAILSKYECLKDAKTINLQGLHMNIWTSIGDDFEFSTNRTAPLEWIWQKYYNKKNSASESNYGFDAYVDKDDSLDSIILDNVGNVAKSLALVSDEGILRTVQSVHGVALMELPAHTEDVSSRVNGVVWKKLRTFSWQTGFSPTSSSEVWEPEGNEVEISPDEIDGMITNVVEVAKTLPQIAVDFKGVATTAHEAIGSMKELVTLTGEAVVALKGNSEKITDSISATSNTISTATTYAFNATRIGLFFKGLLDAMNATEWQDRWMPIATCAMSMGLSPELVVKAGEWLMSSISSILGPVKVNEDHKPEAYEDVWEESWPAFVEKHSNTFKLIAAGIITIATFYMTTSTPAHSKIKDFSTNMINKLKNFAIVGSAIKTLDWLFQWLGHVIKTAFVSVADYVSGGMVSAHQMTSHYPEVIAWLKSIDIYKNEHIRCQLAWDSDSRLKLWSKMDEGQQIMDKLTSKSGSLFNTLSRGMVILQNAHNSAVVARSMAPFREDPFHISLCGTAGVGKSSILTFILDFICNAMKYPRKHRFYSRGEDDEYWTGYLGQICVLIDDMGQDKKGKAIKELIKMKTNLAYPLNMASIEEKGRCFISKLIGSTVNDAYPKPADITCYPALWRRRNLLLEVVDSRPTVVGEPAKWENLRFHILEPVTNGGKQYIQRNLTLQHVLVMATECYKKWSQNQKALVFAGLQGKQLNMPAYGEVGQVAHTVASSFENALRSLKTNVKFTETFMRDFLFNLNKEEWLTIMADVEIMDKIQQYKVYTEFLTQKAPELNVRNVISMIKENPLNSKILEYLKFCRNMNVFKVSVEEGEEILVPLLGGIERPDLGKIVINNIDPSAQQFSWRPEAGDTLFDEILNDVYSKQDKVVEEAMQLQRMASNSVAERTELLSGFDQIIESANARPCGNVIRVADREEIKRFVTNHFNECEPNVQEKLVNECIKVYNSVQTISNGASFVQDELIARFSTLFSEENKKYWKEAIIKEKDKTVNNWIMEFSDAELVNEEVYEMLTLYELMIVEWSQEEINSMRSLSNNPSKLEDNKIVKYLVKFYEERKTKITKWFEDHPNIAMALKAGAAISALFIGYKVIEWVCPKILEKIKNAWKFFFGWISLKVGEEHINKITEVGKGIVSKVQEKSREYYNLIRELMIRSEQPEVMAASLDDEKVILFAEGLERQVRSTANVMALRDRALPEGKRKVFNAYMIGNQDKVITEGTIVEKVTLAEKASSIPKVYTVQGSSDVNATNLRANKVIKNMCRVTWASKERAVNMAGLFVEGRTLMVPYHFFAHCEAGQLFVITMMNGVEFWDVFQPERCKKIRDQDICVYACGPRTGQFAKLTQHFLKSEEVNFYKVPATLNILSESQLLIVHPVEATMVYDISYDSHGEVIKNAVMWEYEARTTKGDCGSVLMADSNNVRSKLLGVHTCGAVDKNIGASSIVTRESLEEAISMLPDILSKVKPIDITPGSIITKDVDLMKMKPEGNFMYLGAVDNHNSVQLPARTEIEESAIHALVREPVTAPVVLTTNDSRCSPGYSPLKRAISKYGKLTIPFNPYDLDYIKNDILCDVQKWKVSMPKRKLTDFEAVFGNDSIDYCDRMNLAASPGYILTPSGVLKKPAWEKGKTWLYSASSEDGIANNQYREQYQLREVMARSGLRVKSVWTDCIKDERKVDVLKARGFMIAPADFVQLCRKYFMAFCVSFYSNNVESFSAVGMDPYSYDWTRLVRKMRKKSNLCFGGDFHSFDGICDPDIMYRMCLIINEWYSKNPEADWSEEDNVVRLVLLEEMIHTVNICLNGIYRKYQGNPSGCPITVILNTFVHCFLIRLAWLSLAREKAPMMASMHRFHQNVAEVYYGDDGLLSVKYDAAQWFNLLSVSNFFASHHIEYTSEDKGQMLYETRSLGECTFLKNGFVLMEGTYFWLAPLSQNTIFELTNWVRKSEDPILQLYENLENAMNFAFHHGREFYERFGHCINIALSKRRLKEIPLGYEVAKSNFLAKCRV